MFNLYLLFGAVLTTLLILVGHWFPWPVRLPRLAAYFYGCMSILIGAAAWLVPTGHPDVWLGVAVLTACAGATTGLAYLIDWASAGRKAQRAFEAALNERSE